MNKKQHDELKRKLEFAKILRSAIKAGNKENFPPLIDLIASLVEELINDIKPTV